MAASFPATRATLPCQPSSRVEQLDTQYSSLFEGVGKLRNYQLKIHTDPNVTLVAQPLRRTPFHIRKDVEKKLQQMAHLDIIEDVEGPTPWVSPLVAVAKPNGEALVCVEMRRVNEAVVRERHPIPTLEETLQAMNGAKVFSNLDLRSSYILTHELLQPSRLILVSNDTSAFFSVYLQLQKSISTSSRYLAGYQCRPEHLRRHHHIWKRPEVARSKPGGDVQASKREWSHLE